MNYFNALQSVQCATEKKGPLTYVSWIEAWAKLKAAHPGATYEVHQTPDGAFLHGEGLVKVSVTVPGALDAPEGPALPVTHTMWLPVMDQRNKQIPQPTTTDINKALMRCLAKACAMHGLGAYVYMGEDLPVEEAPPPRPAKAPALTPAQRELLDAISARGMKPDAVTAMLGGFRLADLSDAAADAVLTRLANTP